MQQNTWGDAPDVEHTINDNSDAIFAAVEKNFPDAWHVNCFAHLTCANVPKCKKCLHSGVDVDDIIKDLTDIANLYSIGRSDDSIKKFKQKHKLQKEFLKVFEAECFEPRNRYWMIGLLCPGTARSNNGMESHFKYFKKEACPEVRQVCDFLASTVNQTRVTLLTINEDCIKNVMHYDVDVEAKKNICKRTS